MAKVITFSRKFPSYHPKAGMPTFFVEKVLRSINPSKIQHKLIIQNAINLIFYSEYLACAPKNHTIRSGKRFKKGDLFSPRVWGDDVNPKSGKKGPYHSRQITLFADTIITNVWDIDIYENHEIHVNGVHFATFGSENCNLIATNDGLQMQDFIDWFPKLPFKGQIICWSDSISYS